MKKLHYLGKKMRDAAQTKIWFGGRTWVQADAQDLDQFGPFLLRGAISNLALKNGTRYGNKTGTDKDLEQQLTDLFWTIKIIQTFRLKVRDLLHAVGKKCGVDPSAIDALDLENVVERTIALNVTSKNNYTIPMWKNSGRSRTTARHERLFWWTTQGTRTPKWPPFNAWGGSTAY